MLRLDLRRLVERERRKMALGSFRPAPGRRNSAGIFRLVCFHPADLGVDSLGRRHLGRDILRRRIRGLEQGRNLEGLVAIERRVPGSLSPEMPARIAARFAFGRWFLAVQLAIVSGWLSFDYAIRRLPMRPYFFAGAVTILLAAAYLEWFAARERHNLRAIWRAWMNLRTKRRILE
jgi:hypothetical protein